MNGTCFVSKKAVKAATFEGKLEKVTIEDSEGNIEEKKDQQFVKAADGPDGYYFALIDIPEDQKTKAALADAQAAVADLTELVATIMAGQATA